MPTLPPSVVRAVLSSWLSLASVGLLAIGVSGLLAAGMGAALGDVFLSGDVPGITYTADRCAELMEYAPEATSCGAAAAAHHVDEVVTYRLAAGVLGLLLLVSWLAWRRRSRADFADALPEEFTASAGVVLFGVVAVDLSLLAISGIVLGAGGGAWLSAAIVSLVVSIAFLIRLYRTLALRVAAGTFSGTGHSPSEEAPQAARIVAN